MKSLIDREDLIFSPPELGCVLFLPGFPAGGNKICDRSPYGNRGTITGATWRQLPSGLWCLSFDGSDDDVKCGNSPSLLIAGDLTQEVWVKKAGSGTRTVISTQIGSTSGYNMLITSTGKVHMRYNGLSTTLTTDDVIDAEWHHLATLCSSSEGELRAYIDGAHSKTQAVTGSPTAPTAIFTIGEYPGGGENFQGYIALVRIYNRVLGALEIQNHFDQEKHLFGVW